MPLFLALFLDTFLAYCGLEMNDKKLQQKTYLIEVIRLLIESETVCECPASTDQVGGSFGLMANERAVLISEDELSNIVFAEIKIGSCARDPYGQDSSKLNAAEH